MDNRITALMDFLDASHSVYHATAYLENILKEQGYTCLRESESWSFVPGGKYYLTRGGSAVIAFRIPDGTPKGFLLSASFSWSSAALLMAEAITTHSLKVEAVSARGME